MRFAYLCLEATYVKCRDAGHMRSEAFITAIGIGDDGYKHFVGFSCANAESYLSWRGFLQDLWEHGVKNVRLITSDAHTVLTKAISEVFPCAAWQRCITHLKRDVLKKVEKKSAKQHALAVMAPIFKESDPALVRALYHEAIDELACLYQVQHAYLRTQRPMPLRICHFHVNIALRSVPTTYRSA